MLKRRPWAAFFMPLCRASGLCRGDHLPGMSQGLFGQVDAAEHPCDLLDASGLVQLGHGRAGFIAAAGLVHEQVVVSLRSHLRQVRDGQDLAALAEAAQQLADDFRGRAADADIDFVEHQRRHARRLCSDHLDRQADP